MKSQFLLGVKIEKYVLPDTEKHQTEHHYYCMSLIMIFGYLILHLIHEQKRTGGSITFRCFCNFIRLEKHLERFRLMCRFLCLFVLFLFLVPFLAS